MDERPNPLEERPFVGELGDALRTAVDQVRTEAPPSASVSRALERARRLGPGKINPWVRYHRIATAAAVAAVLLLTFGLLLVCWRFDPNGRPTAAAPGADVTRPAGNGDEGGNNDVVVGVDHGAGRPRPGGPIEGSFVAAERAPVSTFPLTVDATVYRDLRRALLNEKRLPAPDAVRVADLVNSFTYSYPEPSGGDPVSLTLDLAECPWDSAHELARIGLRGRADATAREARVRVAFNPRRVASYRLIGYEDRHGLPADAESLDAGRSVTALYEITPTGYADAAEWLTAEIRCRDRSDHFWSITRSLSAGPRRFAEAPEDFRFAAAAAEFGLLLRGSAPHGTGYADVRATARGALGADADGRRAEFLALVDAAERLTADRRVTRRKAGTL